MLGLCLGATGTATKEVFLNVIHRSGAACTLNFQMKQADPVSLKASHSASWKWFEKKTKALLLMYNSRLPLYTIIVLTIKSL